MPAIPDANAQSRATLQVAHGFSKARIVSLLPWRR